MLDSVVSELMAGYAVLKRGGAETELERVGNWGLYIYIH
jgi:hypothetical protein